MNRKSNLIMHLWILLLVSSNSLYAQYDSINNQIKVLARPSLDSIVLRWAPMNVEAWIRGSKSGYAVERYTIVRDGEIVNPPVKQILSNSIKVWPEENWEQLVNNNKYAAIAAQSLFGSDFELTMEGTDVFQIVNKVKENEMRFSFGLYAADLSVPVSIAMGLRHTDKNIKRNEKYLYRVLSINQSDTIYGAVFQGPEVFDLPAPQDFDVKFEGPVASLKWDQSFHRGIYTAYIIEKSVNGVDFIPLSDEALVTLTNDDKPENRFQYATDSISNKSKSFYRVRGLTPFGDIGPPSESIGGQGSIAITEVPYIRSDESPDNQVIIISWEFPAELEPGLKGFDLQRMFSPKEHPVSVNETLISPALRQYQDPAPEKNNYYQVVAIALSGEEFKSPVHLAQLIDSIPPIAPVGMEGSVNEKGMVSFSWAPNDEPDIYGYRIYRGNNLRSEFSQVTVGPIASNNFSDSVSLKTLDRFIYYQVMAIDKSQNHSGLSEVLALELPDQVPPVAPVFLPSTSDKSIH